MRHLLTMILAILLIASFYPISLRAHADTIDYDIPNGHFYTQAVAPGTPPGYGHMITDAGTDDRGQTIKFWSEFKRLGGVAALGYPSSERFMLDGFWTQATQRVLLQWRPEVQQVYFVNVFDKLHDQGQDTTLKQRQVPVQVDDNGGFTTFADIAKYRQSWLDANPAIKNFYFTSVANPVLLYGLPTSHVESNSAFDIIRLQRVSIQYWKVTTSYAKPGLITVVLGGDLSKDLGLVPAGVGAPIVGEAMYVPAGKEIYSDTFDSNKGNWIQPDAASGDVSIINGQLHVVSKEEGKGTKTWPQMLNYNLTDFVYEAEVTWVEARSDYPIGLVYRLNPSNDYYLFGIYNNGSYFVGLHNGHFDSPDKEWVNLIASTPNAAIKPGTNVANKLRVVTRGSEAAFYINDQFVNRVFDTKSLQGNIGVLAGNAGIHAAFDNLKVSGNTLFADNFVNNQNGWIEVAESRFFQYGEYHLLNNREQNIAVAGYPQNGAQNLTDFVYEATIKLVDAPKDTTTEYGIIFRNSGINRLYYFGITTNGEYFITRLSEDKFTDFVPNAPSSAINPGVNAVNRLRVVVVGHTITAYINGVQVATANDDLLSSGSIGIWNNNSGVHIVVTNVRVWTP